VKKFLVNILRKIFICIIFAFVFVLFSKTVYGECPAGKSCSENYMLDSGVFGIVESGSSSASFKLVSNVGEQIVGYSSSVLWGVNSGFLNSLDKTFFVSVSPSNINLGRLQVGESNTSTLEVKVRTESPGYHIDIVNGRSGYLYTLRHTQKNEYINDLPFWNPSANSGNGNAQTWTDPYYGGFGFTLYQNNRGEKNTTWWGNGSTENDPRNKYAGVPLTPTPILISSIFDSSARVTSIGIKVVSPYGLSPGRYTGSVNIIAVPNI
jgi:hypothetical protein